MLRLLIALLLSLNFVSTSTAADTDKPLTRIAFGSCAHQDKPLPIWDAIVKVQPELYLALGDNIYADTEDMAIMRKKYAQMAAEPGYQKLRQTCPIMAIWDDHDFGKNDAGAEYPKKVESQAAFLDFFGVPADSPRRAQKGVYHAATFGPPGKRVQIIMVDGRYFRSPLRRGKREPGMSATPYIPNTDPAATMLGTEQWKWLGEQLKEPAEIRLLVSGIQIVAEDHIYEKWANFPAERERLYKLLKDTKAAGVICLSGDRHLAELSMMDAGLGYPLYDLTSSGLNQGTKQWRALEKNSHRVATMGHGDNFGVITIDWGSDPKIGLQARDVDGDITIQQKLLLSDLQPHDAFAKKSAAEEPETKPKTEGAISASDALKKVGEKVVVEMKVQAVGGSPDKRLFLNSKVNFRDADNLAIVVMPKALTGKWEKATGTTFKGKLIRVTGTVSTFKDAVQIMVEEAKQLEVVDNK